MARPWIKLHASMLHHPGIGRLSDRAYRAWITMLLMASQAEESGVIGTVEDVAWQLHATSDDVSAALRELNGKVKRDGDVLTVRDWDEWQEPTTSTERSRRHRRAAAPSGGATLQQRPGDVVQRCDIEEETEGEEETEQPADESAWGQVETAISASYGGADTRTKAGRVKADVGRIMGALGKHAADDPTRAARLWREWWSSFEPRYAPTMHNAPDKLGAWLASRNGGGAKPWTAVDLDDA